MPAEAMHELMPAHGEPELEHGSGTWRMRMRCGLENPSRSRQCELQHARWTLENASWSIELVHGAGALVWRMRAGACALEPGDCQLVHVHGECALEHAL